MPNIAERKLKKIATKYLGLENNYIKSLKDNPGGTLGRKIQILTEWRNRNPDNNIEVRAMLQTESVMSVFL